ncbi:hypothetical protein R3P38DRAFT_2952806 [Favolaschia claudopus]|uniref:Uncharacterized protein n=1 Tax=Favolaschia claudopus TaxID=2862362 RepID=A0AAW0BG54_9AGAR
MRTSPVSLVLTATFGVCLASAELSSADTKPADQPCTVRAWVRAEDLSPNHVSRGELRIKVPRECAQQITSVALRLQLDEFGEVKYLKEGAVLPQVHPSNESASTEYSDWMGSDVVYDYQAYDDGLSNAELWTINAEERKAWATEATLLRNPDLSEPIITPFTVAMPAVNYPAAISSNYRSLHDPVARYSFSDLSYQYLAIVQFVDGHSQDIPIGYTAFIPASETHVQSPFTWNLTFGEKAQARYNNPSQKQREEEEEKCLPKNQRSVFSAEVTLDTGKFAAQGQPLKGRVIVHQLKNGTTTLSDITVGVRSVAREHWAQQQDGDSSDSACSRSRSGQCHTSAVTRQLLFETNLYSTVFAEDDNKEPQHLFPDSNARGPITSSEPHFSFEIQVPRATPMEFVSYYSSIQNLLELQLSVLYPPEVAKCMHPKLDFLDKEEDPTTTEEGLWDTWTPVGKSAVSQTKFYRSLTLEAAVPITILSSDSSEQPMAHYLSPDGALAPVLRSGWRMDMPALFPPAKPVIVVEGIANTTARLMQSGTTDPAQTMQRFMNMSRFRNEFPDPTKSYRSGSYVGVLWQKKIVAEERGIWPPRKEQVSEKSEGQRPFYV